jgi:DNA repair protein SbcC/Rad50
MLPITLSITGFYSYQKKQTIHFEKLTQGGLFGIFGSVGSGKSSILEAIVFALYGDTERLNAKENRSYNMLNLKSKEAKISFEFQNFQHQIYKFEVSWTRNSKNHQKTSVIQRLAYKKENEQWIPLSSNNPVEIIGLSYENFKRTIIIPQGQFKDFLELGDKDRSDMMKQIFKLQAFDLSDKVSKLYSQNEAKRNECLGKLSVYENITQENILEISEQYKSTEKQLIEEKKALEEILLQWTLMQNLKNLQEDWTKANEKWNQLIKSKPEMDLLEQKTELFDRTSRNFANLIQDLNTFKKDLKFQQTLWQELVGKLEIAHQKLESFQGLKIQLLPKIESIPNENAKITALQWLIRYQNEQLNISNFKEAILKGNEFVKSIQNKIHTIDLETDRINKEITSLQTQTVDVNVMMEMQNWFSTQDNIQSSLSKSKSNSEDLNRFMEEKRQIIHPLKEIFELESFENQQDKILKSLNDLSIQKTNFLVQKEVAHIASQLSDDCPCPLCGSLEHPNPMVSEDIQQKLDAIEIQYKKLETHKKEIEHQNQLLNQELASLELISKQKNEVDLEIQKLEKELNNHHLNFVWKSSNITDIKSFDLWKQAQTDIRNEIIKLQEAWMLQKNKSDSEKEILKNSLNKIQVYQTKIESSETNLNLYLEQMKELDLKKYHNFSSHEIEVEVQLLQNEIAENQKTWNELLLQMETLANQISNLTGQKSTTEVSIDTYQKKLNETFEKVNQTLLVQKMDSLEQVQQVLNQKMEVESNREKIKCYKIALQSQENLMKELESKLNNQSFDAEAFHSLTDSKKQKETAIEHGIGNLESLKQKLVDLEQKWLIKLKLQTEFNAIEAKRTDLKTLAQLFQAQGFVNYISGVYLSQLCDMANARFHQLTQNKLSLTLNDKNNFEVIDYLNEGHSRSVKTLSGGQSFQAALCLALALAESIQSLNQSEKNFFFIDEGFGTQDSESISIIYETLTQLHKENRVVGVISHFDELQERITNHIKIINDPEKGSHVLMN